MQFEYEPAGIDPEQALIYLWEVIGPGGDVTYRYVGKARGGADRPLTHYARNVDNLLAGKPYRAGKAAAFREIHHRLAEAVRNGWRRRLTLLRNVVDGEDLDAVERELQMQYDCVTRRRTSSRGTEPRLPKPLPRPAGERAPVVRTEQRGIVWREMGVLEQQGLGTRVQVSAQRDKFVLHPGHPHMWRLTDRPEANGFIRADTRTLLFRDATPTFHQALPGGLRARATASAKGLEFKWRSLGNAEIRELFSLIRKLAGSS
jgi:hypothetical protein